jgi:metal-responsive CopG/Arc/MetJ family transcriptional regulator
LSKGKITVTIEEELVRELDRTAAALNESRSRLVEAAIRTWKNGRIERELIEGYRALAVEDSKVAEENLPAACEALK